MTKISREIEVPVSKQKAWEVLSDFGGICHANPGIKNSFVSSELKTGVGATRHCDLALMGAKLDEKVIEWKEGESLTIEVIKFSKLPGIKSMIANFQVRSAGPNAVIQATLVYTMKNTIFDVMDRLMMRRMNTTIWKTRVAWHAFGVRESGCFVGPLYNIHCALTSSFKIYLYFEMGGEYFY